MNVVAPTDVQALMTDIGKRARAAGAVLVDAGARRALAKGGSLLPAGGTTVESEFQKGDAVLIRDQEGRPVARGLAAYSAEDARRIIGRKSGDFESLLGYRGRDEMIHRDDPVPEP